MRCDEFPFSGSTGVMDAQDNVSITWRLNEIIHRGGEKISLRDVDAVLMDHPAVA
jgi:non-ribosomal peptide synthetase component E (peptide arylation enzyme)